MLTQHGSDLSLEVLLLFQGVGVLSVEVFNLGCGSTLKRILDGTNGLV